MRIEYDDHGRMRYNPSYHDTQGKPWTEEDINYLIEWYDKIQVDEMSFAIGKTIPIIQQKAYILRKKGIMPPATKGRREGGTNNN